MLQGRNPDWAMRPFFAEYDEEATWLSDLRPAFGEKRFFYEDELEALHRGQQPQPQSDALDPTLAGPHHHWAPPRNGRRRILAPGLPFGTPPAAL
jgi:hypothetical protein